jgi:methylglutamate dehydrogenase subunit C
MSGFRLATGGAIVRDQPLRFAFDGRIYNGFAGDTLASALMANGVSLVARSFKYHRPRGVFTAGPEEPSALVTLRTGNRRDVNVPATMIELYDGLIAESQNRWPSLSLDLMAINSLAAPLLFAGFYYKTFMWPRAFWERLYEPLIRRAAGLGHASRAPDPDTYDTRHAHCDVLVIGAGLAGLAAAQAAASGGARVILADQSCALGGATLHDPALGQWGQAMAAALAELPDVTCLPRTTVAAAYGHGVFAAVERVSDHLAAPPEHAVRQRFWTIRARQAILATGAVERLIAVPGNDRPGVMLASAARIYANRYGVAPGRRIAAFVNNDEAYAALRDLAASGLTIAAIVDVRGPTAVSQDAVDQGLPVRFTHEVTRVRGRRRVSGIDLRALGQTKIDVVRCDTLCLSGGYSPHVQLATQAGASVTWNEAIAGFAADAHPTIQPAGAAAGVFGRLEAARHGQQVGFAVSRSLGFSRPAAAVLVQALPPIGEKRDAPLVPLWQVPGKGKAFVDLQHDVTTADIALAHREGYSHIEHAKRYTTHGMGTDQGKTGGLVGAAVLADARGVDVAKVGVSKPRPFVTSVTWGALAGPDVGAHFKPERRLPLHQWHQHHGAVFVPVGLWQRPLVYSRAGDTGWGPVIEEAQAVRRSVGITDVSSLGKIDLQGTDAAVFLDRVYANTFSTLLVGKARYGLMLREDGMVFDDGTIARLASDHFIMTTTTAQAQAVLEHLEFYSAVVWPELDVHLTNVADHWAQFAIAGPQSTVVLERVVTGCALDTAAFAFMAASAATIADVPGRIFRLSFSGERAYEVAVPARHAERVWTAILKAGGEFGIRPYGLDALNVLRIEKGHVAGSELNGQTTATDLGLGKMLKKQGDFIGRRLADRPGMTDPNRQTLVAVTPVNPDQRLRNGALLVHPDHASHSIGFLTAACMSSLTDGWIGLALLAAGCERYGEVLVATSPVHDESIDVVISSPHRYDPESTRVLG